MSLSEMQSTSKYHTAETPHCREYCDGNVAEFYCPECAAMFCSSCYDREHSGNERKSQHRKLSELRSICSIHKHTLDYFNLTLLQPMCVICKNETMLTPEHEHHVIDHIETTVPKLRCLIEKKLESASELIERLTRQLTKVENAARRAMNASISYIERCFTKLRQFLDERESELLKEAKKYFNEFIESGKGIVETRNALKNVKALSEEGKLFLKEDTRSPAAEFLSVFMRLKELCASSSSGEQRANKFQIVIDFEESFIKQLREVGTMTIDLIPGNEKSGNSRVTVDKDHSFTHQPDFKRGLKRHFSDPPSKEEPGAKQAKHTDDVQFHSSFDFTYECNKTTTTRVKATATTPLNIATPSPVKLRKATARKSAQSPRYSPSSSPRPKADVASPRGKRGGPLSKEFMKCDDILIELWRQDESFPFTRPVDTKEAPDYDQVVKNPMDLTTIKEKLSALQYRSPADFVKDMRLMLNNCRLYNEPGTDVYTAGEELENLFNRLLKENFPNFEDEPLEDCDDGSPCKK